MELLICTVINVLDVLGVTAWGNTDISLQKNKKQKKTDFLDFCFSKGEVDHSKQRAVCLGAVIMFMGTSQLQLPSAVRFSPK